MAILDNKIIPKSLYDEDTLYFPEIITSNYKAQLTKQGLYDLAISNECSQKNIEGGCDKESSDSHYACRYLASVSRIQFSLLGLKDSYSNISEYLLTTFSDGVVSILDIPSGTGAGTFSILSTICELRDKELLPPTPLYIHLTIADCSQDALNTFKDKLHRIEQELYKRNIHIISFLDHHWDAKNKELTAIILEKWLKQETEERIVLVSAFSGATKRKSDFNSLNYVFEYLSHRLLTEPATLLFFEPEMKSTEKDYLSWIKNIFQFIQDGLKTIFKGSGRFYWHHPLLNEKKDSNVIVLKIQRDGKIDE